ncbi:MAG TPA: Asp-tRNA(Asn)/Glu-tRNA(Gln) amidotransferase subunit GatC [Candidatus Nanoarchaeia archaeon]
MRKKLTLSEVKHVATLANLPLEASELTTFSKQLSEVIDYNMTLLAKVDTKDIEPTAHVTGAKNIQRPDVTEPGLTQKEALKNSKSVHNGFFKVKAILEQE